MGRGQMSGRARMPYAGSAQLNDFTSWQTASTGMNLARNSGKRIYESVSAMSAIHQQGIADARQRNYGAFTGGIHRMMSSAGGLSPQLANMLKVFLTRVNTAGGKDIGSGTLAREFKALRDNVLSAAGGATGASQTMLNTFAKTLGDAAEKAFKGGGWANLGGASRDVLRQGIGFKNIKTASGAADDVINKLTRTAEHMVDGPLKRSTYGAIDTLNHLKNNAKDAADVLKVLAKAEGHARDLASKNPDAKTRKELAQIADEAATKKEAVENTIEARKGYLKAHEAKQGWGKVWGALGRGFGYAGHIKRMFDASNQMFQFVNQKVNAFARMQMAVSSERGGYGRQIRGAGINYGHMMTAIGAGRSAGMEDRQVINQMVSLQEDLAKARWGESSMINAAGRWGISTFDANGQVKEAHDLMIEFSRKLNSLGSKQEKLQFLSHIGRRPEEMEYVANYEQQAKRMEMLKRNPHMMGVLERADMLDETGMQAKIDAHTKIEQRRRELLNQNAIDQGVIPGLIRSLHPENWFFNDWTARQKGVENAKSEVAMKKLTDELKRVQAVVKQNSKEIKENGAGAIPLALSAETLQGMALTGGWAEQDLKNRGANSSVYDLRALYAQQLGLKNLDSIDKKNRVASAAVGGLGGAAAGAGVGAAIGSFIPILGTAVGAIVGAIVGGISGGAYGGMAGYNNPFFDFDDGSGKHLKALRNMKGLNNSGAMIEKYVREHHLEGLTPEMVESDDFKDDAKARKMLQGAFTTGIGIEAQALTDKDIDLERAKLFNKDKFYLANKAAAKKAGNSISRERVVEAFARSGSGDESVGLDSETAYNYIKFGYDPNSAETKMAISKEIGQLRVQKGNEGKSYEELKTQAENNVRDRFYEGVSRDVYEKAIAYTSDKGAHENLSNLFRKNWEKMPTRAEKAGLDGAWVQKLRLGQLGGRDTIKRVINGLQNDPDVKNRSEKIAVLQEVAAQIGYNSADEYAKARTANALDPTKINAALMKDGKLPFRLLSEQQKSEKLRSAISGDTRKVSLGAKLRKFARENKISLDEARGLLMEGGGVRSEEESMEVSKSSKAQNERRNAEAEARKAQTRQKHSDLITGTSEDQLRGILGDEYSMYEDYNELRRKKNLTPEEQAEKDKLEGEIARKITSAKRREGRGAGFRSSYKRTAAERVADKATFGTARQLMKRRDRMKNNRPLAEVSDMTRIHGLVKNGMTDEQIVQNFGKERFAQYKGYVKSGKIEDLEKEKKLSKEEKRAKFEKGYKEWLESTGRSKEWQEEQLKSRMAAYDSQQATIDARKAKIVKNGPKEGKGEYKSGFTAEGAAATMEETAQAANKMAKNASESEKAAATGNAAAAAGAATNKEVHNTYNVAGATVTQTFTGDNVSSEEVKKGTVDGMQKSNNLLIAAFNNNNESVGMK